MSKRSHGEGSISKRKDGRWQASLQVDGNRSTVYGKTRREAYAKLRELQQLVESPTTLPVATNSHTVNELFDAWLKSASNLKQSTLAQHRWHLEKYVRPTLGEIRLDRVTPDRLQELYAGLTPAVADKVHRLLHRAFAVAVMWDWLASNPCDRVLKPAYRAKPKTLWNNTELNTFLERTAGDWLHPLWVMLISTGCRLGEALALGWNDVGKDNTAITVKRTLHNIDGAWVLDTAKTDNAVRTIRLPEIATEALTVQQSQQSAWRDAAGSRWEDWNLVFTSETGKPVQDSTVQHAIKRECHRLNLPVITPHGLRHLHASLLLDQGVPVTAVSARLGHANPQITLKIYAHALPGQDKRAADAIGGVLRKKSDTAEPGATKTE